jgi:hypothetical protein
MQANPEVMRFLVDGRTHTRRSLEDHGWFSGGWLLRGYGLWACVRADTSRFVGSIGIFQPLDWPEPELAYSLDRPFWGQGFATEATTAARDWLFGHFTLARLASFIRPDNHASIRVAERLGAVVKVQSSCTACMHDRLRIEHIIRIVLAWATAQPKIRAVALVGSHARGAARQDSDIDLVLLVRYPQGFRANTTWIE